jgi:3D (Asp-Asp-Asp) domain-containing protein
MQRRAAFLLLAAHSLHMQISTTSGAEVLVQQGSAIDASRMISLKEVTFYGFPDNCPPSAQPHSNGTGTYDDPITFAAAPAAIKHGTLLYIAHYQKYFIMDDVCEECEQDWKRDGVYHVDLWLGPTNMQQNYTRLVGCEDAMTDGKAKEGTLNPAPNLEVDTTPFYNAKEDSCMNHAEPCYETCNPQIECNECGGLSGSCEKIAKIFSLSIECFQQLNPRVDCGKGLHGQTFCQGSGCPLRNGSNT